MEEVLKTQVLEELSTISYMAELYTLNLFDKDEL